MKLKKFSSLILALIMLVMPLSAFAQDAAAEQAEVQEYSNYMIKNAIRTYAHTIANNYYYGIDDDELLFSIICQGIDDGKIDINNAVQAMIETLDENYAEFYTPEEYKNLQEDVSGEISGIGVMILQNSKGIVVTSVIDNSPALRAGILAGDYIVGVNGNSTEGLTSNQVRALVVGTTGTEVKITVKRGESVIDLTCIRAVVEVSHVTTKMISDDIAYLKLDQFTHGAVDEVSDYVNTLKKNNTKKLVIDLRNNPGGELEAAVEMSQIFLSAGKIGELRYKDQEKNEIIYSRNYNAPRLKLVVLVNENSASASEFFSAALQGRKAATIIGTQTLGKGSMQILMRIVTGAGMKFTIGEFFAYDGSRIHETGITPDIVVENEKEDVLEENFEEIDIDKVQLGQIDEGLTLALEQRLGALGYFEGEPDGVYDEETTESVRTLQNVLGYESTGVAGFYEYLYLKDLNYDFEITVDTQLETAVNHLNKK